jgi:hypothetical protein
MDIFGLQYGHLISNTCYGTLTLFVGFYKIIIHRCCSKIFTIDHFNSELWQTRKAYMYTVIVLMAGVLTAAICCL